jgi:calcineurin-like phosphoesterase
LTGIPYKFEVAKKNICLQSVVLDIDEATGKSRSIERLNVSLKAEAERPRE